VGMIHHVVAVWGGHSSPPLLRLVFLFLISLSRAVTTDANEFSTYKI
jgi:hypothetical protein